MQHSLTNLKLKLSTLSSSSRNPEKVQTKSLQSQSHNWITFALMNLLSQLNSNTLGLVPNGYEGLINEEEVDLSWYQK